MRGDAKNVVNSNLALEELRKTYRTTVIIGASIIASLFVYLLIVEVIRSKFKPFPGFVAIPEIQVLRYLFYGFAFLEIVAMIIIRPILSKEQATDDLKSFLFKLNRKAIATYVFLEVPAILGFVLFLLGGRQKDFYIFFLLSLILEILYFPKLKNWEEALRNRIMSPRL